MFDLAMEWLNLVLRWMHLIFGIAWIGSSFFFVWLDNSLRKSADQQAGVLGQAWLIHGGGFYFTATERNPRADGFKFMNQGALQAGDLTLWFTILTNEGQDTVAVEALAMLQGAVHRRTGHDQL